MFVQAFTVFLAFVLQAAASPDQRQSVFKASDDCPTGIHIIGVYGDLEYPGFGALQDVVDQLMDTLPGSDAMAIDYPAFVITIGCDRASTYCFPLVQSLGDVGSRQFHCRVRGLR